jgi:hypothetical protein
MFLFISDIFNVGFSYHGDKNTSFPFLYTQNHFLPNTPNHAPPLITAGIPTCGAPYRL